MKRFFLYLLLSGYWLLVQSQVPADSSFISYEVEELRYHSVFEHKVFDEYEDGESDYLSLISALNPDTDEREVELYSDWIDEIVEAIRKDRFERLSEEKKIKAVNTYVKRSLLITYSQKTTFDDLFRFGNYNFITAACIYALVLDELNIPYRINESLSHIYLLAFPETGKIVVETTVSEFRYFLFDHATRTSFVQYLRDNDLIDEITFRSKTTKELFDKYFFPQITLSLQELAGLQYLHKALENIENEEHKTAYFNLQKAYYLYPSCKVQYMLLVELYEILKALELTSAEDLVYLAIAPRYIPIGFNPDYFLKRFSDITVIYLFEQENINEYDRIFRYLKGEVNNQYIFDNMSLLYYFELGRMYFNSGKYEMALDNLEKAFDYQAVNKEMQALFVRAVAGFATTSGAAELIPRLEYYDEEFEIVEQYDIYLMVKMHTYLQYFGESFQVGDAATGDTYMAEFENLVRDNPEIGIDHYMLGRSYSSAAIYYYQRGDIERSKQIVNQGLELAPDNIELRLKLDSFRE